MRYTLFMLLIGTSLFGQVQNYVSTRVSAEPVVPSEMKYYDSTLYRCGWMHTKAYQGYISATDVSGQVLWEKTYPQGSRDEYWSAIDANFNSIYCVGSTRDTSQSRYEGVITRLNHSGNVLWQMRVPQMQLSDVLCLGNGNVLVLGHKGCMCIDSMGGELWLRMDSVAGFRDLKYSDIAVIDSCIFLTGSTYRISYPRPSVVITKLDMNGQVLWCKRLSSEPSSYSVTWYSSAVANDSALFIAGWTMWPGPSGNTYTFCLFKLDGNGTVLAASGVVPSTPYRTLRDMVCTPYNTLAAIGTSTTTCYLYEFDCNTLMCNRTTAMSAVNSSGSIAMDSAGNTWFSFSDNLHAGIGGIDYGWNTGCGFTGSAFAVPSGQYGIFQATVVNSGVPALIKALAHDSVVISSWNRCVNPVGVEETEASAPLLYPNPATDAFSLQLDQPALHAQTLSVLNAQGQCVEAVQIARGQQSVYVSTAGWCAGMYFVLMEDGRALQLEVAGE